MPIPNQELGFFNETESNTIPNWKSHLLKNQIEAEPRLKRPFCTPLIYSLFQHLSRDSKMLISLCTCGVTSIMLIALSVHVFLMLGSGSIMLIALSVHVFLMLGSG